MIDIQHITKHYGAHPVLQDVSFRIKDEGIFGLFGRNGTGKTTLMYILTNRIFADSGKVVVDGRSHKAPKALRDTYLMSEQDLLPKDIKIATLLRWTAGFYPNFDMDLAHNLARSFDLDLKKNLSALSTGYRTIAKTIIALATNARYTFLDEPILGLDAAHRSLFYQTLVNAYSTNPRSFLLSTHLIGEAAGLVEHVYFLHRGRLIEDSPTDALTAGAVSLRGSYDQLAPLMKHPAYLQHTTLGGMHTLHFARQPEQIPEGISTQPLGLEELFILRTTD